MSRNRTSTLLRALLAVTLGTLLLTASASSATTRDEDAPLRITIFQPKDPGIAEHGWSDEWKADWTHDWDDDWIDDWPTVTTVDRPVVDPRSRTRVGTNTTQIHLLRIPGDDDVRFLLDGTTWLNDGQITFSGYGDTDDLDDSVIFTIIDGTGDYAGAVGMVKATARTLLGMDGGYLSFTLTP